VKRNNSAHGIKSNLVHLCILMPMYSANSPCKRVLDKLHTLY